MGPDVGDVFLRGRTATVAWGLCGLTALLAVPTLLLLANGLGNSTPGDSFGLGGAGGLSFVAASLAFATTGALVASRVPENPIGWIFCVMGLLVGLGDLAYQYADFALFGTASSPPGGETAAWLQNLGLPPAFGLLALSLLLFPDGRLPSRRWRPALWLAVTGMAFVVIGYAFRPGPLDDPFATVENPFGISGTYDVMDALSGLGWLSMAVAVALAAAAMVHRLRRSSGQEHQQLKWIALAASVAGVLVVADVASFFLSVEGISQLRIVALGLAFVGFPVAAGVAILRYRLYDIDVVINRTLVYGALTATLAATYLGSVLLLQLALGGLTSDSSLAIAASTLAVAAVFRPARTRIQEVVDRRFYRLRYDAARTLESFGSRLRDEVALDSLSSELCIVVAETMQPAHVSLWLRGAEVRR
jgi:hypothetical protein